MNLLIVDDESSLRKTLQLTLESLGHRVHDAANGSAAKSLLESQTFDLCFLDLRLGRESGLDLLPALLQTAPDMGVIVMTAYAAVETAVEAMRIGAFDYLPKPFKPDQLRLLIDRWQQVNGLRREVTALRRQVDAQSSDDELVSAEPAMQAALAVAKQVAPTDAAVLLRGESGTGKGVLSRWIHKNSKRAAKPFVTVHCPSLSRELLESELFGHAKGAFTGAVTATEGKIASAEGGTLFLDEIGDLPLELQPKLLRFLQEKTYERVGEAKPRVGDVRIIAATNRDLDEAVSRGSFREDLLYRLNVIEITMPPLRERRADIPGIAQSLLCSFAQQTGKPVERFSPEAMVVIRKHTWPGNIRELRNAIERGTILANGSEIGPEHLPVQTSRSRRMDVGGNVTIEELEAEHIRRVLAATPSLDEVAIILGIDASTLYRKRKKLGL